jgi:Arc/MetJ-type ribon-helix-helix transcriptional regulator
MAKVRKFDTGVAGQGAPKPAPSAPHENIVPDISPEAADRVAASAPVKIMPNQGRGNPRKRRYRQKTYSLLQEDIDLIEALVAEIRQAGLYERGRSDVVRAGVRLLSTLPAAEKLKAVEAVADLKRSAGYLA